MSQEKVDLNKEKKSKMKKEVKMRKVYARLGGVVAILVAVVIVGYVGFSIKQQVEKNHEANPKTTEVKLGEIVDFSTDD
jgi:type VI protein secretion system component VasF